jgi:hypothetical protein
VEFNTQAALQAAIAAGPIDIGDNYKIVVEERRKSSKTADAKTKQLNVDRRMGTKPDEGRMAAPKKPSRTGGGSASHKTRTE